ncbi:DUF3592 domain-containing protein [Phragmitibacter flavus]|nr:DUF3592 domain-containing protein [Phragmitibacter flavus]
MTLLFGGGSMLWMGVAGLWPAMRSTSWPSVEGRVVATRVVSEYHSKGARPAVGVVYRYEVDGMEYRGERFSHSSATPGVPEADEARARQEFGTQAAFAAWQPGKRVRVYYDPKDPAQAVLMRGRVWVGWALTGLGLGVFFIGLLEWRRIRRRMKVEREGGGCEDAQGSQAG